MTSPVAPSSPTGDSPSIPHPLERNVTGWAADTASTQ